MSEAAPDGSPVELYARLAPMGEPELIHSAVPAGCEILELGCGAGRITHALVALGHPVVAVDNSPEMLERVRDAETVLADIESLDLGRLFPAVVLASHFVNDPDPRRRVRLLETCARHLDSAGVALLERLPPEWEPQTDDGWAERGGVRMRLVGASTRGPLVDGVMEYDVGGTVVRHAFTSQLLSDDELDAELVAAGLRRRRTLGESATWVEAVPAEPSAIIRS